MFYQKKDNFIIWFLANIGDEITKERKSYVFQPYTAIITNDNMYLLDVQNAHGPVS